MYHYERSKALSPSKQQAQPGQDILIEPAVTSPVRDPWESEGRKFITKVFQNVLRREPLLPGLDHKGNLSVTNKLLDLFPFFFFFFFSWTQSTKISWALTVQASPSWVAEGKPGCSVDGSKFGASHIGFTLQVYDLPAFYGSLPRASFLYKPASSSASKDS